MEILVLFDNKNRYIGTFATDRQDDSEVLKADVIKAFEKARKTQCLNPDIAFRDLFESELENFDIVQCTDATKVNLPKHKALLIYNGNDADLIIEDGGYAFLYLADGVIHLDLYQGRIERKIGPDDKIEDIAMEHCDKTYWKAFDESSINNGMIDEAIQWLCTGMEFDDFDIIEVDATKVDYNKTVNEFLNLE